MLYIEIVMRLLGISEDDARRVVDAMESNGFDFSEATEEEYEETAKQYL